MAAYGTAALVRSVANAFDDSTDWPDATLLGWVTNRADPEIDAALKAAGFSPPITSPDELLIIISSMLAAAFGLVSATGQRTYGANEAATALRDDARDLLNRICDMELDIGITKSDSGDMMVYDSDPETFHSREAVYGDETKWSRWPETRAED